MIFGLICARGGSKRLPGKNTKPLCGKPMVAWTIEAALTAGTLDRVAVSTEDNDISNVADEWGATVFKRPDWLASDTATIYDVVRYHLKGDMGDLSARDCIVILQPTSPLRTAEDIDACVKKWLEDIPRQSSAARETKANGAIYMAPASLFADRDFNFDFHKGVHRYEMVGSKSIDINTQEDFDLAEQLMRIRLSSEAMMRSA